MDAGDDVFAGRAGSEQADDLRFRKDHAHTADRRRGGALGGHRAQGLKLDAETLGDNFEKTPRSRGAAIVHHKIPDFAGSVQSQKFAVLAADINNGPGLRHEMAHADGVTGDLGDCRIGQAHGVSSVARRDDGGDIFSRQATVIQNPVEKVRSELVLFDALVGEALTDNVEVVGVD